MIPLNAVSLSIILDGEGIGLNYSVHNKSILNWCETITTHNSSFSMNLQNQQGHNCVKQRTSQNFCGKEGLDFGKWQGVVYNYLMTMNGLVVRNAQIDPLAWQEQDRIHHISFKSLRSRLLRKVWACTFLSCCFFSNTCPLASCSFLSLIQSHNWDASRQANGHPKIDVWTPTCRTTNFRVLPCLSEQQLWGRS